MAEGDKLAFDSAVFTQLAGSTSLADKFRLSSQAAVGGDDYLVYDPLSGQLGYDVSGTGSAVVLIATLSNLPQNFGAQQLVMVL